MQKYNLDLHTEFLGKRIDYYETIDSTHLLAKRLKNDEIQDGMVILADNQTAGIGTHERKWYTGKGKNLSFNMLFLPNCEMKKIESITIIIAQTIVKTIKDLYDIKLSIKKPNDIIYKEKKIAGILTECVARGSKLKKLYIGIGINVNQTEFPGTLKNIASSLKNEFGRDFNREEILKKFLEEFEKEYKKMIDF